MSMTTLPAALPALAKMDGADAAAPSPPSPVDSGSTLIAKRELGEKPQAQGTDLSGRVKVLSRLDALALRYSGFLDQAHYDVDKKNVMSEVNGLHAKGHVKEALALINKLGSRSFLVNAYCYLQAGEIKQAFEQLEHCKADKTLEPGFKVILADMYRCFLAMCPNKADAYISLADLVDSAQKEDLLLQAATIKARLGLYDSVAELLIKVNRIDSAIMQTVFGLEGTVEGLTLIGQAFETADKLDLAIALYHILFIVSSEGSWGLRYQMVGLCKQCRNIEDVKAKRCPVPLPSEIMIEYLMGPCPYTPDKQVWQTHRIDTILAALHPTSGQSNYWAVTLNQKIAKTALTEGYQLPTPMEMRFFATPRTGGGTSVVRQIATSERSQKRNGPLTWAVRRYT